MTNAAQPISTPPTAAAHASAPTPDDGYPAIAEELVLDDLASFKALANPLRLKLLHELRSARSVTDVASSLDVPKTRLYYHINALAEAGIIEVLDTRKVGTQIEKIYRIVGKQIRPGPAVWENVDDPYDFAEVAATLVIDPARVELVESLAYSASDGFDLERINGTLGRTIASIPRERVAEFSERVNTIATDMAEANAEDGLVVTFTYVLLPIDPEESLNLRKEST